MSTISELILPAAVIKDNLSKLFEAGSGEAIATLSDPPQEPPGDLALLASEQNSGQVLFEPTGDNQEPQGSEPYDAGSDNIEPEETEPGNWDEEL